MKKLFFSAVALMAFSGVSLATGSDSNMDSEVKLVTFSVCSNVYLDTYQAAIDNGASEQQASAVAWAAYRSCVNSMVDPPKNPQYKIYQGLSMIGLFSINLISLFKH